MKKTFFHKLAGAALGIALFAAAMMPFAAFAQAQPAAKPDGTRDYTITLNGGIDGMGTFVFQGAAIRYEHKLYNEPTGITVNGELWKDLKTPFELDFTPDFSTFMFKSIDGRGKLDLTTSADKAELAVSDPESGAAEYTITFRMKGTPRKAGTGDTPAAVERKETTAAQTVKSATEQTVETATEQAAEQASSSGPIVIEGTFNGIGRFEFVGSSIRYRHIGMQMPAGLKVNGKSWPMTGLQYYPSSGGPAPDSEFNLGFTPDYRSAKIVESEHAGTPRLTLGTDGMELFVSEMSGAPTPGRIRIEADPAQKEDAPAQDRDRATVTIECQGGSEGYFVFRENRIVFEAEDRSERAMPTKVTVNDTLWPDLDSSRMLGFMPDLRTAEILEESGPGTVSHTRLTGQLKLYFNNRSTMRNAPPVRFTISVTKKAPSEKPDDRFNVTLRAKLAGNIAGFRFQGRRIIYYPIFGDAPSDVTVNGKPWDNLDKPFELDFATNPAAAEILEKSAGPLTPSKYSDGFVVRLGGRLWTGNSQFVAKLNDESEATTEKPAGQETIKLEMRLQGSARLRFRDDKLYFTLFSGAYPNSGITVNGKPWNDPETPFELGFVPDFGSMTILDRRGPIVELTPGKDKAELLLNSHGALNTFQVELAVKKQTDAVPESAPVNTQTAATRGVDSDVRLPAGPQFGPFGFAGSSNAGIRSDTIIFEALTETQCMFTFEDDTLECRELTSPGVHSDGPTITLNGRILRDFAKPVYLGFVPDYEHAEVSVTYRARSQVVRSPWMPVNVKREGKKMIVTTLDMDDRSLLESSSYSVRIVLKKPGTSDTAKPDAAAAAKAQDGRFADEGELRQWNMMMQGIVEAMEGGVRLRHMTFDADVCGAGTFVIHGDEIHYRHEPGQPLPDVTINGTHWDDLDEPFVLAFVPQLYSEAVSYQFDADSAVASYAFSPISMVWSDNNKLMLSTRAIPDGKGGNCHYRVRFNLPEINPRRVGGFSTQRPAQTQSNSNGQKPDGDTTKTDAEEEVRVVIEGIFEFRETLEFHDNTITYATHANRPPERMFGRERPWIAINGKEWTDLAKPFVLDFTPDYTVRAKLVETQGRTNPMLSPMSQGAKVEFNDYQDDGDYYKLVISFRKSKP